MKKISLIVAASAMTFAAAAQTVIAPPSIEDAQAKGYEPLWGDYQYGYVLPNGYVLADTDDLKVTMDNGNADKPGANIAMTGINTKVFDKSFQMGSAAAYGNAEPFYTLSSISAGIKQPYAVFTVEAKAGGELTMYFNRGNNKCTIYALDITTLDTEGICYYVNANSVHPQDLSKEFVSKTTFGLIKDHKYWVFAAETGANLNMYEMVFTPYTSEAYSVAEFDASKFTTAILPPSIEDAQAKGYEPLWGDYQYGYVLPNAAVVADTEDLKVTVDNGSTEKPGANIAMTGINTKVFDKSFQMGSAAAYGNAEPFYTLSSIAAGIKQPYAVFTVEAKKGGDLTMYFNRGNNKCTIYALDITTLDTEGICYYVLANSVHPQDLSKELVSKATFGLIKDHKYWVFAAETGANLNMYAMGFNNYEAPNYSYTGSGESGVNDIVTESMPQSDVIYNVMGQKVDETYKGIVIKNGKKFIQK